MEKFLYKYIQYLLQQANIQYSYYAMFNNQIESEEVSNVSFPAVLFEPLAFNVDYHIGDRQMLGLLQFNLHIYSEMYDAIVEDSEIENRFFEHFDLVKDITKAIDAKFTDGVDREYQILDDQDNYELGVIDVKSKKHNPQRYKNLNYTTITFEARYSDLSNLNEDELARRVKIKSLEAQDEYNFRFNIE